VYLEISCNFNVWPQVNFLTEISRDPGSRFLPFASLKQKHRSASHKTRKSCVGRIFLCFVRRRGLEPPRPKGHIHLKDAWLPITTPAQIVKFPF